MPDRKVPEEIWSAFCEALPDGPIGVIWNRAMYSALEAALKQYNSELLGADALNAAEAKRQEGLRAATIVSTAIDSVSKGGGKRTAIGGTTPGGVTYTAHFDGEPSPEQVEALEQIVEAAQGKLAAEDAAQMPGETARINQGQGGKDG